MARICSVVRAYGTVHLFGCISLQETLLSICGPSVRPSELGSATTAKALDMNPELQCLTPETVNFVFQTSPRVFWFKLDSSVLCLLEKPTRRALQPSDATSCHSKLGTWQNLNLKRPQGPKKQALILHYFMRPMPLDSKTNSSIGTLRIQVCVRESVA